VSLCQSPYFSDNGSCWVAAKNYMEHVPVHVASYCMSAKSVLLVRLVPGRFRATFGFFYFINYSSNYLLIKSFLIYLSRDITILIRG